MGEKGKRRREEQKHRKTAGVGTAAGVGGRMSGVGIEQAGMVWGVSMCSNVETFCRVLP